MVYDAESAARPLKRIIQQKVEDPLSDKLLSGEFHNGDSILITLNSDNEIILEHQGEPEPEAAPAV